MAGLWAFEASSRDGEPASARERHPPNVHGGMATPVGGGRGVTVKAKVVLLGEGAVGKTSLVLRYSENRFNDKHVQTLQVGE